MLYASADDWLQAPAKRVLFFGMSGLGKTHVSDMLRRQAGWFHYSVDYRIGTRYLGEAIADNAKREAMKNPFLGDLLRSDSIYIGSNISFNNLAPMSAYLGKPGDPKQGGLSIEEFRKRQAQFKAAEIAALQDTAYFIDRAQALYGYSNFVCDTGGSFCEWVNPADAADPLLAELSKECLLVWIKGSDAHTAELIRRFDAAPKPMCYQPEFLDQCWAEYLAETGASEAKVDPDAFVRWTYARALAHRQPIYAEIAENWGLAIDATSLGAAQTPAEIDGVIAAALEAQGKSA